jgi:hypothetical protein
MKRISLILIAILAFLFSSTLLPQLGYSKQSVEIVGGELVTDRESPEYLHTTRLLVQATIGTEGVPQSIQGRQMGWRCSGAILDEKSIISAAHCFPKTKVVSIPGTNEFVWVPLVDMKVSIYYELTSGVGPINGTIANKIIVHPEYNEKWVGNVSNTWNPIERINDLAIVMLSESIPTSKHYVKLLPTEHAVYRNDELILTGFGKSGIENPFEKPYLRKVIVPYNDMIRNGSEFYAGIGNFNTPGEISNPAGGCAGDSGGPAFTNINGEYYLTGVIIRGPDTNHGGCKAGLTILTDVRTYYEWIQDTLYNN